MSLPQEHEIDDLLSSIAGVLDIPDHYYEEAVRAYEDIGGYLAEEDSPLFISTPEIYPQGSFRLGTVVQPHANMYEYDIDLVCCLTIKKESITQKELKKRIGDRLKSRPDLNEKLDELGRCWRLSYAQQFHMDVLPVIPDVDKPDTGILLTDKNLRLWQKSDPIAYADWFYERMKPIAEETRAAIAESKQASIEEVPEWRVRTPLQRVVQLLKRHRDIYFADDLSDSPSSILITTLAAHAYRNQKVISEALSDVVEKMADHIENRDGVWWVENPVHSGENFADKWRTSPERRQKFYEWLARAERDFIEAMKRTNVKEASDYLTRSLGQALVQEASARLSLALELPTSKGILVEALQVPSLAESDHCRPMRWPERIIRKASLTAGVYAKKYGTKELWSLSNRPVPKMKWLKFVLRTNAAPPFKVWWQVVNTGKEAREARCLRGNFEMEDPQNRLVRWETTAYTGTHWVEGFVVKDGACIARTGRTLVKVR